ncbi:MAG: PAS domain S-box protein [Bacteroidetes bacterium]|nr:PAS domain S-box protein [Bacteroidota bacterium]
MKRTEPRKKSIEVKSSKASVGSQKKLEAYKLQYQTLTEHAPVGIFRTDPSGSTTYVNPKWTEIAGISAEEALGTGWYKVVHPDDFKRICLDWEQRAKLGEVSSAEYRFLRPDGTIRWVLGKAVPEKDANGNLLGYVGTITDITELKHTEEILQRFSKLLQGSEKVARLGYFEYDFQKGFTNCSESFYEILGIQKDSLKHISDWDFCAHPNDSRVIQEFYKKVFRIGGYYEREYRIHRQSDGAIRWVRSAGFVELDKGGKPHRVLGFFQDITEQKLQQEDLLRRQEQFQQLFNNMAEGVALHELIYDHNGTPIDYKILGCNPAYERILGISADSVCNRYATEVYKVEKAPFLDEYATVVNTKTTKQMDVYYQPMKKHFHISVIPWNTHGFATIFFDITEQKEAERILRESEQRYRSLFENAIEGLFRLTSNGTIEAVNPACAKIFGYATPSEMKLAITDIGSQLFVRKNDYETLCSQIQQYGEIKDFTLEVQHRTKQRAWIKLNVKAVKDASGTIIHYEGNIEDITEKRRIEEQFLEAQKMESVGTLAGGIAHDFNNILGIILGYVTLLRNESLPREKVLECLNTIEKNIERGATLVRQVLTFARKAEVVLQPLNVNDALTDLAEMLGKTFPKTIDIVLQLERSIPVLEMDHTQFNQIILNLCVNARDAMNDQGTLTLATKLVSGKELEHRDPSLIHSTFLRVSVSDTGMGIPANIRDKIFEPFFTTKEKGKGTGLGLSVVYGVVKSHNGYIEIQTSLGKGTTFHLYFPVTNRSDVTLSNKPLVESSVLGGDEVILLVEDEKEFRTITKQILESAGYTVLTANDGVVAMQMLEISGDRVDLLLTDINMPRLSGLDVVASVRESYPHIKILLTSGFVTDEYREEHFIQKPFTREQLLRKVRQVLDS